MWLSEFCSSDKQINMTHTFIANSGIQFYLSHITIDMNAASMHLFHEWFDEEQVEQVLEYAYEIRET